MRKDKEEAEEAEEVAAAAAAAAKVSRVALPVAQPAQEAVKLPIWVPRPARQAHGAAPNQTPLALEQVWYQCD